MYEVWVITDEGAYLYLRTTNNAKAAKVYVELADLWPEFLVSISHESKLLAI